MLRCLLILAFVGSCAAQSCGRSTQWYNCSSAGTPEASIYYIDTTPSLTANQVAKEFAYIRQNLVGNIGLLNNGVFQSFVPEHYATYGTGGAINTPNSAQNASLACSQLDSELNSYQTTSSQYVSLVQVLTSYSQDPFSALIFIFSGSTDDNDIDAAASYVMNHIGNPFITLIALEGASTRFEAHPNAWKVYRIPDMTNPPPGVAFCIAKRTCFETATCESAAYTTFAPISTMRPATTPTTQPATLGTTRAARTTVSTTMQPNVSVNAGHGCSTCDYSKVWNDVVYVIDSSEATGSTNLGEIWGLVQSISPWFNVQKTSYIASNYSMRVGIVTYGSSASLVSPLGSINEDDIDFMDIPLRQGDSGTNLASALQTAAAELNSAAHRPNAKQVIVVLATTYKSGNYDTPGNAAASFTDAGGIIIVYEDVKDTSSHSATLQHIASPGYFISSLNSNITTKLQAMCDANCFCPANFLSLSSNLRQNPTGGCYRASTVPANFNVAKRSCQQKFNNGFIASDVSFAQTSFLQDIFGTPTNFYIGLKMDSLTGNWNWEDGSELGSYQPWFNGVPTSSASGSCVYVAQGTQQWVQTDCRNGYLYTCESNPCDSTHYCPLSQD